jgi:hypothetical protein
MTMKMSAGAGAAVKFFILGERARAANADDQDKTPPKDAPPLEHVPDLFDLQDVQVCGLCVCVCVRESG